MKEPPESMVRAVQAVARVFAHAKKEGQLEGCRFRLPPEEITLIAPLEALTGAIAANDESRAMLENIVHSLPDFTVNMLRAAMETAGIAPDEIVSLTHFGIAISES